MEQVITDKYFIEGIRMAIKARNPLELLVRLSELPGWDFNKKYVAGVMWQAHDAFHALYYYSQGVYLRFIIKDNVDSITVTVHIREAGEGG